MTSALGPWSLGSSPVKLVVHTDQAQGGWFDFDEQAIHVCIKGLGWNGCLAIILHEALEYAVHSTGRSYVRADDYLGAADCRTFILTHAEFTVTCSHAAGWLAHALPELSERFNQYQQEQKHAAEEAVPPPF